MKLTLLKSVLFRTRAILVRSRQAHYYLGITLAPLLLLVLLAGSAVLDVGSTDTKGPHTAELEYASFSETTGESGGSVIPASCDSGVGHFNGDLDGCLVWIQYCTGADDANGNYWQWWEYSDTDPFRDREYRFVRAGDGTCTPPPPPVAPYGWLDSVTCEGGVIYANGWTCDPDNFNAALGVHIYRDNSADAGGTYVTAGTANLSRGAGVAAACGGNGDHGYRIALPSSLSDGVYRNFYAHAIDDGSRGAAANPVLSDGPEGVSCRPLPPVQTTPTGSCYNSQQNLSFAWTQAPGSTENQINLYGISVAECNAMGWTPYYTPATGAYETCYAIWPASWLGVSFGPGATYNLGNMSGRTVTMALMTKSANSVLSAPQWVTTTCSPPQPPVQTAPTSYCYNGEQNMYFDWTQAPGATQNQINLYGISVAECNAMGWTPYYTPATGVYETCYNPAWPAAWDALALGVGGSYNLGNMVGRTVTMALMTRSTNSALSAPLWTTATCRSLPPPPTGGTGSCSADGTVGTFSWTPPSGYNTFYTRGIVTGTPFVQGVLGSNENFVGPPYTQTFATTPGQSYTWWVHTKDPSIAGVNWSTHIGGSFTCPIPSTPQPPGVTCNPAGTAASITWSSTGASHYFFNFYGLSAATCPAGFTWDGTSACYWHNIPSSFGTTINIPLTPGGSHRAIIWPGSFNSIDIPGRIDVGPFTCPTPPPPPPPPPPPVDPVASPSSPPTVDLTANPALTRSGTPARLTWTASSTSPIRCTLSGGGSSVTLPDYPAGISVNSPNPYLTAPITNTTTFTLSCAPISGGTIVSDTARVQVVPSIEEI